VGFTAALGDAVPDDRDPSYVTHDMLTLLRQRVYQIAATYEDANDATYLRHDPTQQSVARRLGTPSGFSTMSTGVPSARYGMSSSGRMRGT
jgi:hypothetical protein